MPELNQNEIEAILSRFKFVAGAHIEAEHLKNYSFYAEKDFDTDNIVLKLFYRPFGEIITEIKYPADWKEALKEVIFNWINKQYRKWIDFRKKPVDSLVLLDTYKLIKYKRYDVAAYYPRISLPNEEKVMTFRPKEASNDTNNS